MGQKFWALYLKTWVPSRQHLAEFFPEGGTFHGKSYKNIKRYKETDFLSNTFFSESPTLRDKHEKYGSAGQAIDART